ncbi:MAG: alpha/beta hydrolase [Myxococcota bacterium]
MSPPLPLRGNSTQAKVVGQHGSPVAAAVTDEPALSRAIVGNNRVVALGAHKPSALSPSIRSSLQSALKPPIEPGSIAPEVNAAVAAESESVAACWAAKRQPAESAKAPVVSRVKLRQEPAKIRNRWVVTLWVIKKIINVLTLVPLAILLTPIILVGKAIAALGGPSFGRFLQRLFLFRETDVDSEKLVGCDGWVRERIQSSKHVALNGLIRPPPTADAPWVLFFGGNASGLDKNQVVLDRLQQEGPMGLATFAYRGYDGSQGKASERKLVADGLAVVKHLEKAYGVKPEQLVIVGHSLGSGIAAQVARKTRGKLRGLVLVSAYSSMANLIDDIVPIIPMGWAFPDKYDTENVIADVNAQVLLIHGKQDPLIPLSHSKLLHRKLKKRARLLIADNNGHNDIWQNAKVYKGIAKLVAGDAASEKLP